MRFLRYFWFWIRANNRHGIHSPFVYALMEKAVFDNQSSNLTEKIILADKKFREFSYFDRKRIRLFLKLIDFFKPKQLVWIGNNHQNVFDFLEDTFQEIRFSQIQPNEKSVFQNELKTIDWLVVDTKSMDLAFLHQLSNDSKIFVLESGNEFFRLKKEWDVKVELDFFFMKILLFRKEMKPQIFRLRS